MYAFRRLSEESCHFLMTHFVPFLLETTRVCGWRILDFNELSTIPIVVKRRSLVAYQLARGTIFSLAS